jgi:hypothetical protein
MESVYHIVTIRVNETSWTHVWRLRSRYLGTGYDNPTQRAMSCCLYKYRSRPIITMVNQINRIYTFILFCLVFFSFRQLDFLATASISKVVVVDISPPSRRHFFGGGHRSPSKPLTPVGLDRTRRSDLINWTIHFAYVLSRSF